MSVPSQPLTPPILTGPVIARRVRDAIVVNLRNQFALDPVYPYIENPDGTLNINTTPPYTQIAINDATPIDFLIYPCITVENLSGEEHRFLQQDYFEQFKDASGNVFNRRGAPMTMEVTIKATALDTVVRDQVLDRLYERFKILTDYLSASGVGVVKTSLLADGREFPYDRWIYTSGIRMTLYVEWTEINPIGATLAKITGTVTTEDQAISESFKL
jgi:hypothetical protein